MSRYKGVKKLRKVTSHGRQRIKERIGDLSLREQNKLFEQAKRYGKSPQELKEPFKEFYTYKLKHQKAKSIKIKVYNSKVFIYQYKRLLTVYPLQSKEEIEEILNKRKELKLMNTDNTRKIKFSITKDYVTQWNLWEAIREIIQNAQDNPNGMEIKWNDTYLTIKNPDTKLNVNTLVLGVGNKTDDDTKIGGFSEGSLLAMVVLTRLGKRVEVQNADELWTSSFEYDPELDCELLTLTVKETKLRNKSFSYRIYDLTENEVQDLSLKSLSLREALHKSLGKTVESDYGTILFDDKFQGKFFVEGLYIQTDISFKYGYSFKNEYVQLDRDRKAINYYDLLELTTQSLLNSKESITLVETAIVNNYKDVEDLKDLYTNIPQEFAVDYADKFLEKHSLDKETFIGTEAETKASGKEKVFITDKVQAKIVNQGLDKEDEYKYVQELSKQKDSVDLAWRYYDDGVRKKLITWLTDNAKRLSNKQINSLIDIILDRDLDTNYYNNIKDDVEDNLLIGISQVNSKFRREEK